MYLETDNPNGVINSYYGGQSGIYTLITPLVILDNNSQLVYEARNTPQLPSAFYGKNRNISRGFSFASVTAQILNCIYQEAPFIEENDFLGIYRIRSPRIIVPRLVRVVPVSCSRDLLHDGYDMMPLDEACSPDSPFTETTRIVIENARTQQTTKRTI